MKKNILLLVLFVFISLHSKADGYTATLQHGENVTAFYGIDAFKKAYSAAVDSDVITLSPGNFTTVDSVCKSITIRGNYAMGVSDSTTYLPSLKISANKVWIDGIYFSTNLILSKISDCKISHSWIEGNLYAIGIHTNTVIDQCVIKNESANRLGNNYCITNSTISYFSSINTSSNIAYISNCVIYNWCTNNMPEFRQPYAIYKNNLIYLYDVSSCTVYAPNEFYNNVFFHWSNESCGSSPVVASGCIFSNNKTNFKWGSISSSVSYPATMISTFSIKGQDGTLCGPLGGKGFSYYPGVPHITSAKIDPNTNSEGKLNVKISVSVQK
jgi:hypothetical protein